VNGLGIHILGEITLVDAANVLHAAPDGAQFDLVSFSKSRRGLKPRRTLPSVCGKLRLRPYVVAAIDRETCTEHGGCTVPWPPRVAKAAEFGFTRCGDCHALTGKRRPSATWDDVVDRETPCP
jgi:hypothetical protein